MSEPRSLMRQYNAQRSLSLGSDLVNLRGKTERAHRWHAKSVIPTPTGAKGVVECFSAASIRTERTRAAVMNISMNTPLALLVPSDNSVLHTQSEPFTSVGRRETHSTVKGPGNNACTNAAAAIEPNNCATQYNTNLTGPIAPTIINASEIFGLNSPPVTL
jgi:hypothetical protein